MKKKRVAKKRPATKPKPEYVIPPPTSGPVNVAIPNTSEMKMAAIVECAKALNQLAKAINSVNYTVTVSNNVIHGVEQAVTVSGLT